MFIRNTNRILSNGKLSVFSAAYGEGGDIKYDFFKFKNKNEFGFHLFSNDDKY